MRIGIGDVVLHVPSGEEWLVARADEERAIFSDELRRLPQGDPRRVEP